MKNIPTPTQLLTVPEILEYLKEYRGMRVSRATVYNWITKGRKGQTLKITKKYRSTLIKRGDLDEFINTYCY